MHDLIELSHANIMLWYYTYNLQAYNDLTKNKIIDARQPWDVGGEKKRIRKVRPWRFLGSEKFIGYLRVGLRKNWFKSCCCLFRVSHVPSVQFGVGELRAPVSSALWHFPTKFVQNLELDLVWSVCWKYLKQFMFPTIHPKSIRTITILSIS